MSESISKIALLCRSQNNRPHKRPKFAWKSDNWRKNSHVRNLAQNRVSTVACLRCLSQDWSTLRQEAWEYGRTCVENLLIGSLRCIKIINQLIKIFRCEIQCVCGAFINSRIRPSQLLDQVRKHFFILRNDKTYVFIKLKSQDNVENLWNGGNI